MTRRNTLLAAGLLSGGLSLFYFLNRPAPPPAKHPAAPTPAALGYVDSALCTECHAAIAKSYARTGMARSFGAVRGGVAFPSGQFTHKPSLQTFEMSSPDGRPRVRRHVEGGEERSAQVDYWIGSGNRGRGYITRAPSGRLQLLPVTHYAAAGWAMNPGYDRPNHAGFDRVVDYRCLSCHAAYPAVAAAGPAPANGWQIPADLPQAIDCQRCHGPGAAHVEAFRTGKPLAEARSAIVNPARLSPERQLEVCMQCHLETTSESLPNEIVHFDKGVFGCRPGQPLGEWLTSFDFAAGSGRQDRFEFVNSVYRLRQSSCFRESEGRMTCSSCHNPHDTTASPAAYKAACMKCHEGKLSTAHPPAAECVTCHMPKRTPTDAIRLRVADHKIVRRPSPVEPNLETEPAHTAYRGEVAVYYPTSGGERELYAALAQVTQQTNLARGAPRLEVLIEKLRPEHGEFYLQLGNAWLNLQRPDKARRWLEESAKRMPNDWRPSVLLASLDAPAAAAVRLRRATVLAPREPVPLLRTAELALREGRFGDAIESLQSALRIDPESAEAHSLLASARMKSGDGNGAELALREAVRLQPESPVFRTNLASLLVLKGDTAGARAQFERVTRIHPAHLDARVAFANLLELEGALAEAAAQLESAISLNPADPTLRRRLNAIRTRLTRPARRIPDL